MSWPRLIASLTAHSLLHPRDGIALARVGWRFRRRGWWHRFPFLPLPATSYVRWRLYTAYADEHAVPPADDLIRYARWATRDA